MAKGNDEIRKGLSVTWYQVEAPSWFFQYTGKWWSVSTIVEGQAAGDGLLMSAFLSEVVMCLCVFLVL